MVDGIGIHFGDGVVSIILKQTEWRQLGVSKICFSTDDALAVACPSFDKDRLTSCILNLQKGSGLVGGPNRILFTWPMRKQYYSTDLPTVSGPLSLLITISLITKFPKSISSYDYTRNADAPIHGTELPARHGYLCATISSMFTI